MNILYGCFSANLPPNKIPWAALRSLLSQAVYGGKVDNDSDQRLLDSFVNQIFTEKRFVVDDECNFLTNDVPIAALSTRSSL